MQSGFEKVYGSSLGALIHVIDEVQKQLSEWERGTDIPSAISWTRAILIHLHSTEESKGVRQDEKLKEKKVKVKSLNLSLLSPGTSEAMSDIKAIRYIWSAMDSAPLIPWLTHPFLFVVYTIQYNSIR